MINFDGGCDEKSSNYSYLLKIEFLKVLKGQDEMVQCVVIVTNFLVLFYDLEALLFRNSTASTGSPEPFEGTRSKYDSFLLGSILQQDLQKYTVLFSERQQEFMLGYD